MLQFRLEEEPSRWLRYEEIDSTNSLLLNGDQASGTVCVAHRQTAGRGRRGRRWENPSGRALLFSGVVAGTMDADSDRFRLAPFLVGAALLSAIEALMRSAVGVRPGGPKLKWPNDIYWSGPQGDGKLAGVLLESRFERPSRAGGAGHLRLVLGVGLNWQGVPTDVQDNAADLFAPGISAPGPEALLGLFVERFGVMGEQAPSAWLEGYRRNDLLLGREVRTGGRTLRCVEIDARGCLVLADSSGSSVVIEDTLPDFELLPQSPACP